MRISVFKLANKRAVPVNHFTYSTCLCCFCYRLPQFQALRGIWESSRELMFVKYIPVYSMLSLAITQPDAKREGKCLLDLKCLVWEKRSGCRKKPSREWYKASLNPGLTRERHIKSVAAQRRERSVRPGPPGALIQRV